MDRAIFKAYDVRGLYPSQIDPDAARAIGRALARHLGIRPGEGGCVAVGRDMRESGLALREALLEGLLCEGADVVDVGRVSTPMLYHATAALGARGGVMITASHNPGAYNGLKLCAEQARPIGLESGLAEIRDLALALHDAEPGPARGHREERSLAQEYADGMLALFSRCPALRVVADAGNGIAGEALLPLFERLPIDLVPLYFEPDGSFPHHEADPLKPENVRDLQREVLARGAALGVAFDGDGDRAFFVDEKGARIPADLMTALLARTVCEQGLLGMQKGGSIVYDLRSSRVVRETLESLGAHGIRTRVGHAYMKQRMRETGARFGGELSGHYYFHFPLDYVADDGAAALLLLLETLGRSGRPLSELWRPFRRYAQSGEVNMRVADVRASLERVRKAFPDGRADELDGLTVSFDDWWFNLRPSNTEPLLRLNVEAASEAEVQAHRDRLVALIQSGAG